MLGGRSRGRLCAGLLAALAMVAGLSACAGEGGDPGASDPRQLRIVAGSNSLGCFGPLWLAIQAGMFEAQGLAVDLVVTDGASTVSALSSGQADLGFSGSVQVVQAIMQGQGQLKIVTPTAVGMAAKVVVSNTWAQRNGITANSDLQEKAAALRGARIGSSGPGQTSDLALRAVLEMGGLDPDADTEIVALGVEAQEMIAALQHDQVDAFILSEPGPTLAQKNGTGTIIVDPGRGDVPGWESMAYCVGASTDEVIAERSDVVVDAMKALYDAEKMLSDDPDSARAQLRQRFESMDEETFDLTFDATSASWATDPEPTTDNITQLVDFWASSGGERDADAATYERIADPDPAREAKAG